VGLLRAVGAGPVALDTCVFIYLIEEHPTYLPVLAPLFAAVDAGQLPAVTSALTILEVLVVPFRHGDAALAAHYEALLCGSRGLETVDVGAVILRDAAALRASTGLRTPDAIQLATALAHGCSALVTNDRAFPSIRDLRVIQLRDFVETTPRVSER